MPEFQGVPLGFPSSLGRPRGRPVGGLGFLTLGARMLAGGGAEAASLGVAMS